MPQYMLLIYADEATAPARGTPEGDARRAEWLDVTAKIAETGQMVAGDALDSVSAATTVRLRDGERVITDGPFAETREQLAGYYLLDCPDLDAAIEWAAQLPNLPEGSVEVRPTLMVTAGVG